MDFEQILLRQQINNLELTLALVSKEMIITQAFLRTQFESGWTAFYKGNKNRSKEPVLHQRNLPNGKLVADGICAIRDGSGGQSSTDDMDISSVGNQENLMGSGGDEIHSSSISEVSVTESSSQETIQQHRISTDDSLINTTNSQNQLEPEVAVLHPLLLNPSVPNPAFVGDDEVEIVHVQIIKEEPAPSETPNQGTLYSPTPVDKPTNEAEGMNSSSNNSEEESTQETATDHALCIGDKDNVLKEAVLPHISSEAVTMPDVTISSNIGDDDGDVQIVHVNFVKEEGTDLTEPTERVNSSSEHLMDEEILIVETEKAQTSLDSSIEMREEYNNPECGKMQNGIKAPTVVKNKRQNVYRRKRKPLRYKESAVKPLTKKILKVTLEKIAEINLPKACVNNKGTTETEGTSLHHNPPTAVVEVSQKFGEVQEERIPSIKQKSSKYAESTSRRGEYESDPSYSPNISSQGSNTAVKKKLKNSGPFKLTQGQKGEGKGNPTKRTHNVKQSFKVQRFPCTEPNCKSVFLNKHRLRTHTEDVHISRSGEPSHKCDFSGCEKRYFSSKGLRMHIINRHDFSDRNVCNICGKRLSKLACLRDHLRIHENGKHPCPKTRCSNSYTSKSLLIKHLEAQH